jgi:hypothetical protein
MGLFGTEYIGNQKIPTLSTSTYAGDENEIKNLCRSIYNSTTPIPVLQAKSGWKIVENHPEVEN